MVAGQSDPNGRGKQQFGPWLCANLSIRRMVAGGDSNQFKTAEMEENESSLAKAAVTEEIMHANFQSTNLSALMENKEGERSLKEGSFILGDSLPMTPPAGAKYIGTWDSVSGRMKWDNLVFSTKTQLKDTDDVAELAVSKVFQKEPHVETFNFSAATHVVRSQPGTNKNNLLEELIGPKESHKSPSNHSKVAVSLSKSEEPIAGWRRRPRGNGKNVPLAVHNSATQKKRKAAEASKDNKADGCQKGKKIYVKKSSFTDGGSVVAVSQPHHAQ
jgi:hypothetical protein